MAAKDAAGFELDDFAAEVLNAPHWVLETGCQGPVLLAGHTHKRGARLSFSADLAGSAVDIAVEPDGSGWLSVTAMYCGREVFRAWMDRPYEEYELWPPGAHIPPRRTLEAPGRIGKRRNWINLSTGGWPHLARFANASGVCAAIAYDEQSGRS